MAKTILILQGKYASSCSWILWKKVSVLVNLCKFFSCSSIRERLIRELCLCWWLFLFRILVNVSAILCVKSYHPARNGALMKMTCVRPVKTLCAVNENQWPLAGGTPTTLYSIWTYDNDRSLKYSLMISCQYLDL